MNLSPHFTLEEATHSQLAARYNIDNRVPTWIMPAVINTAQHMEMVRSILDAPIIVSSWYRCEDLNHLVKSSSTSQHLKGEAVDFIAPKAGSPKEICEALLTWKNHLSWDELIFEHTWVHISWNSIPNATQRKLVLSLTANGTYVPGIH